MTIQKEDRWVRIHQTNTLASAEFIKGLLEEHEFPVQLLNKLDSAYVGIGHVEIYVLKEDAVRAIHVIQKFNDE